MRAGATSAECAIEQGVGIEPVREMDAEPCRRGWLPQSGNIVCTRATNPKLKTASVMRAHSSASGVGAGGRVPAVTHSRPFGARVAHGREQREDARADRELAGSCIRQTLGEQVSHAQDQDHARARACGDL